MYTYEYTHIYIYVYIYDHLHSCIYIHMYIQDIYICMCTSIYIYIYIYITYIYINPPSALHSHASPRPLCGRSPSPPRPNNPGGLSGGLSPDSAGGLAPHGPNSAGGPRPLCKATKACKTRTNDLLSATVVSAGSMTGRHNCEA